MYLKSFEFVKLSLFYKKNCYYIILVHNNGSYFVGYVVNAVFKFII